MQIEKHIINVKDGYNRREITLEIPADISGPEFVGELAIIMQWLTWPSKTVENSFADWLEEKGWKVKDKEEAEE